jgi:hypothetical protein
MLTKAYLHLTVGRSGKAALGSTLEIKNIKGDYAEGIEHETAAGTAADTVDLL